MTALIVAIDEAIDEANPDSPRARRLALLAAKQAALGEADVRAAWEAEAAATSSADASTEALFLSDIRKLLTPDPEAGEFQRQYAAALADTREVVVAHASVLRALALPAALPS